MISTTILLWIVTSIFFAVFCRLDDKGAFESAGFVAAVVVVMGILSIACTICVFLKYLP